LEIELRVQAPQAVDLSIGKGDQDPLNLIPREKSQKAFSSVLFMIS
jgi:hypothetical protein